MPTIEHEISFNKTVAGIKSHVKRHQVAYSLGAGFAIAGITCLIMRGHIEALALRGACGPETADILVANRPLSLFSNRMTNNVTTVLVRRGHPGKMIQCNETGEVFASISRGAEVMGLNRPNLTSHLNGRLPHVGGYTFTSLGEAV